MIKSKLTTYQWFGQRFLIIMLVGLPMIFFLVIYFIPIIYHDVPGLIFLALFNILLPVYIFFQLKINAKTTSIDSESKTIYFKDFLTGKVKSYPFTYFDGFIDTIVTDQYDSYKCFYLVKEKKLYYKISGRFYRNIDELEKGIKSLKHIQSIKMTTKLSLLIALEKQILP